MTKRTTTTVLLLLLAMAAPGVARAQETYVLDAPGPLIALDPTAELRLIQFTIARPYRNAEGKWVGEDVLIADFIAAGADHCARSPNNPTDCQRVHLRLTGSRARELRNSINRCTSGAGNQCSYGPNDTLSEALFALPEFLAVAPAGGVVGTPDVPEPTTTSGPSPTPSPTQAGG